MTLPGLNLRLLVGKLLIIAGIGLVAVWTCYFVQLVRPIDLWDFFPLSVALTVTLLGVKFTSLRELILAQSLVSYKRDLVSGLALGVLAELCLWAFLFFVVSDDLKMAEWYIRLERLQAPGRKVGVAIYRYSYSRLGGVASRYIGTLCAFMIPIAIWSLVAFAVLRIARPFRSAQFSK